jgi:hypothetical protein
VEAAIHISFSPIAFLLQNTVLFFDKTACNTYLLYNIYGARFFPQRRAFFFPRSRGRRAKIVETVEFYTALNTCIADALRCHSKGIPICHASTCTGACTVPLKKTRTRYNWQQTMTNTGQQNETAPTCYLHLVYLLLVACYLYRVYHRFEDDIAT